MKHVDFTISDSDLHAVLSEIDAELRASSTKPFGREIRGLSLFCQKFKLNMAWSDPFAVRIFDWFTNQYGDRLRGNLDFGNTVAEIRHDLYSLRFPCLFGTKVVFCDPLLSDFDFGPHIATGGAVLKTNLFEHLGGATRDFIKSLAISECENLLRAYTRGFVALSRMKEAQEAPYAKEALDDLHQSAVHLTAYSPNYGFSRWASLQAAEKLLKSYITVQERKFPKSHNLAELASIAASAGLPTPSPVLLQEIQCAPDVRYEANSASKAQALRAHYAVLSLCGDIAPHLQPQLGWASAVWLFSYAVNGTLRPMKALRVSRWKRV